jgi:glucose/arabinose dehydrogenase
MDTDQDDSPPVRAKQGARRRSRAMDAAAAALILLVAAAIIGFLLVDRLARHDPVIQGGWVLPSPPTAPSPAGSAATAPSPSTSGLASSPPTPGLGAITVATVTVVDGLEAPLFVTGAGDGSGRLFVAEQPGRIRTRRDGVLDPKPFLDIADRVAYGGERGLLGFAFPPGFGASRPVVYVHYSNLAGDTTLSAFRLDPADQDRLDPGSEQVLLSVGQPYANHNGGWIGFDRSGMLLVALGDGGSGGDPENRASDTSQLLGKILRLDVTGAADGQPYAIPSSNPFADGAGGRPEILHWGLRNPFRDSVDPLTGALWIGDVGQGTWEEVDVAPEGSSGLDFGWRRWEGAHCFNPPTGCDPAGVTMPVAEYRHGPGCSITGGVVYRGTENPALAGTYLFSDYCAGTLWGLDASGSGNPSVRILLETGGNISGIGTDDRGEVYLTDLRGALLRLVDGA